MCSNCSNLKQPNSNPKRKRYDVPNDSLVARQITCSLLCSLDRPLRVLAGNTGNLVLVWFAPRCLPLLLCEDSSLNNPSNQLYLRSIAFWNEMFNPSSVNSFSRSGATWFRMLKLLSRSLNGSYSSKAKLKVFLLWIVQRFILLMTFEEIELACWRKLYWFGLGCCRQDTSCSTDGEIYDEGHGW